MVWLKIGNNSFLKGFFYSCTMQTLLNTGNQSLVDYVAIGYLTLHSQMFVAAL